MSRRNFSVAAALSAIAVGASLVAATGAGAATAQHPTAATAATSHAPAKPYGTVAAHTGLNGRWYPSTDSPVSDTYRRGTKLGLDCKVRAQSVHGNPVWYHLRTEDDVWVAAYYVAKTGSVPYCIDKNDDGGYGESLRPVG